MSILIILQCSFQKKIIPTQVHSTTTTANDNTTINALSLGAVATILIAKNNSKYNTSSPETSNQEYLIRTKPLTSEDLESLKTKMQDVFTNSHIEQINEYITNFEIIKEIAAKLGIKNIEKNISMKSFTVIIEAIKSVITVVSYDDRIFKDDIDTIKTMAINTQKQYKFKSKSQINRILQATNKDDILYSDLSSLYQYNCINVTYPYDIKRTAALLRIKETYMNHDLLYQDVEKVYKEIFNRISKDGLTLYNKNKTLFKNNAIRISNRYDELRKISITEWETNQNQINSIYIVNGSEYILLNYITKNYETIHLSTFIINKGNNTITIQDNDGYNNHFFIHSSILDALITILKEYKLKVSDEQ